MKTVPGVIRIGVYRRPSAVSIFIRVHLWFLSTARPAAIFQLQPGTDGRTGTMRVDSLGNWMTPNGTKRISWREWLQYGPFLAQVVVTRMPPDLRTRWLGELVTMTVEGAVELVRSMIPRSRPRRENGS